MGNITPLTITTNEVVSPLNQDQQNTTPTTMRNVNDEELAISNSQDGTGQMICALQPKIKSSVSDSPNNSDEKQLDTCCLSKPKTNTLKSKEMTLQQYRKAIGLKIQNEKRSKKLEISVNRIHIVLHKVLC